MGLNEVLSFERIDSNSLNLFEISEQLPINQPHTISRHNYLKFENVESALAWGDKNYKEWLNSLSEEEKGAFDYYTFSSAIINSYFRGIEVPPKFLPKALGQVPFLDQVLLRAIVPENITVYRGVTEKMLGDYRFCSPEELIGKTITDKGYMSCSLCPGESMYDDYPVTLIIEVPQNTRGAFIANELSKHKNETELLLLRGQTMKIRKCYKVDGEWKIFCRLINDKK